jgi:hypothetical protein
VAAPAQPPGRLYVIRITLLFRLHDCYDAFQLKPMKRLGILGIHHGDALETEANSTTRNWMHIAIRFRLYALQIRKGILPSFRSYAASATSDLTQR